MLELCLLIVGLVGSALFGWWKFAQDGQPKEKQLASDDPKPTETTRSKTPATIQKSQPAEWNAVLSVAQKKLDAQKDGVNAEKLEVKAANALRAARRLGAMSEIERERVLNSERLQDLHGS